MSRITAEIAADWRGAAKLPASWRPMLAIVAAIFASAALTSLCYAFSDIHFLHAERLFLPFAGALAAIVALSAYIKLRAPGAEHLVVLLFMAFAFFVTATNLLLLQYCLATTRAIPMTDAIRAADHAMGFDWTDFAAKVSAIPCAADVIGFCYRQWIVEFVIAISLLGALRKIDDIFQLTFAYVAAGAAMVAVSGVVDVKSIDAVAAYATHAVHLPTGVNPHYLELLTALRSDGAHVVDLDHLGGLVSFPSCHAGAALLLATATRNLKALWLPFLIFNELILVGTITEGGHYLSDVIAGCAFAIAGLAVYDWAVSRPRGVLPGSPRLSIA